MIGVASKRSESNATASLKAALIVSPEYRLTSQLDATTTSRLQVTIVYQVQHVRIQRFAGKENLEVGNWTGTCDWFPYCPPLSNNGGFDLFLPISRCGALSSD